MARGTVVLFQPDHVGAGKILFEPKDVAHLGAAPAIDRLVVVAHAADVHVPLRQKPEPEILRYIGVLIFVDEDVAEPPAVLLEQVIVLLEDLDHVEQEIAEIDRVQRLQPRLVFGVERGALPVEGAGIGGGDLVGRQRAILPAVDDRGQLPRRPAFLVDPGGADQLFHQPDLVVGVEDGEIGLQPHELRMAAQKLDADRVKRAEPGHPLDGLPHQLSHAPAHLARGLVGEGDGQDLVRPRRPGGQKMRDPRGQRARLAGARARQHQHRAVEPLHRIALRGVQPVEIGLGPRGHGLRGQRNGGGGLERLGIVETAHTRIIGRIGAGLKLCSPIVPRSCGGPGALPRTPAVFGER